MKQLLKCKNLTRSDVGVESIFYGYGDTKQHHFTE